MARAQGNKRFQTRVKVFGDVVCLGTYASLEEAKAVEDEFRKDLEVYRQFCIRSHIPYCKGGHLEPECFPSLYVEYSEIPTLAPKVYGSRSRSTTLVEHKVRGIELVWCGSCSKYVPEVAYGSKTG